MSTMGDIRIRRATKDDAQALLEIYRPYVERTAITFEYDVPTLNEFRSRIESTLERYPYLVAEEHCEEGAGQNRKKEEKGKILGYAYTGTFKGRRAYDWAVETSIYVDMNRRRDGVGRNLYRELEEISKRQHILNMNACIAVPQDAEDQYLTYGSERFHEHMGYSLVGRFHRCACKFGRWYDMIWMEKFLGQHPNDPQPVVPYPDL